MQFRFPVVRLQLSRAVAARRAKSLRSGLVVEPLEGRVLMTTNSWKTAVSGDWSDAADWSLGHVPKSTEIAAITVKGNYTVTHSKTTTDSVAGLTISEPLVLEAGTIAVSGTTLVEGGSLTIKGGVLHNGSLSLSGSGAFVTTSTGGALDNVTIASNLSLASGSSLDLRDTTTFSKSVKISVGTAKLYLQDESTGAPSVLGTGTISLNGGTLSSTNNHGHSPTIGSGILVDGTGTANFSSGVNNGTIRADVAAKSLVIIGSLTNAKSGIVGASNDATLHLSSPSTFTNAGVLSAAAGTVLISGAFKCGTGTLLIGIGGTSQGNTYGLINVAGALTLGGTLTVETLNSYAPSKTATFVPLKYTSETGSFSTTNLTSGNTTFQAAIAGTSLTLSIQTGIVLTLSYTTLQIATNSTFTTGLQTITLSSTSANNITLKPGEYFRFGITAVVTGNPNPVAGDAWDKSNQKAGNPAQPANLGLAVFGMQIFTTGGSASVVAPVSKGGTSTASLSPTNLPPYAIAYAGDVSGGDVGLNSPLGAGWLPPGPTTTAGVEELGAFTTSNTLFSNLAYQVKGAGKTTITPTINDQAISFWSEETPGSPGNPATYQSELYTSSDTIKNPAPINITVS